MSNLLVPTEAKIVPVRPDYHTSDVRESFDWPKIIRNIEEVQDINLRTGGVVLSLFEFGSFERPGVDPDRIDRDNTAAYERAKQSPSFLGYFQGVENEEGKIISRDKNGFSLSLCLWKDYAAALLSVHGPNSEEHQRAAGSAEDNYGDRWYLETRSVIPSDDSVLIIDHDNPHSRKNRGFIYNA